VLFHLRLIGGDGNDRRALQRAERLAKVSGWQQTVAEVGAAEENNIDVPVKLAMLEAIVEQMQSKA
jgi:hypothetical protein